MWAMQVKVLAWMCPRLEWKSRPILMLNLCLSGNVSEWIGLFNIASSQSRGQWAQVMWKYKQWNNTYIDNTQIIFFEKPQFIIVLYSFKYLSNLLKYV